MATFDSPLFGTWVLSPYGVAGGDWIRLLGSGFLHFGLLHLAVNMFALYILGRDTELILGRARYVAVYMISLLGGSASVMAFERRAASRPAPRVRSSASWARRRSFCCVSGAVRRRSSG